MHEFEISLHGRRRSNDKEIRLETKRNRNKLKNVPKKE